MKASIKAASIIAAYWAVVGAIAIWPHTVGPVLIWTLTAAAVLGFHWFMFTLLRDSFRVAEKNK